MIALNMHTQMLITATTIQIIVGVVVIFALVVYVVSLFRFDDNDADMYREDNFQEPNADYYAECHRPFVALPKDCPHTGSKTDSVVWVACTCEEVHTFCDDCGENLSIRMDC